MKNDEDITSGTQGWLLEGKRGVNLITRVAQARRTYTRHAIILASSALSFQVCLRLSRLVPRRWKGASSCYLRRSHVRCMDWFFCYGLSCLQWCYVVARVVRSAVWTLLLLFTFSTVASLLYILCLVQQVLFIFKTKEYQQEEARVNAVVVGEWGVRAGRRKEAKRTEEREKWVQDVVTGLWEEMAVGRARGGIGSSGIFGVGGGAIGGGGGGGSVHSGHVNGDWRLELDAINTTLNDVEERVRLLRESLDALN